MGLANEISGLRHIARPMQQTQTWTRKNYLAMAGTTTGYSLIVRAG